MDTHAPSQTLVSRSDRLRHVKERIERNTSRLLWAVDALIPADPSLGMPSASEASVIDVHLPQALTLRDDMQDRFFAAVERLPAEAPANGLETLQALGPADFDLLCRMIAGSFFLDEKVNAALGYTAQQAITATPDYDYLMEAIEPVIERGQIYTAV
ncbi:hypothetical protein [Shinella sp. NM-101]|uniref:hypothetical protein n=1 Tax=Shinella sp. NM-101 TaxID=2744455 RepID=UPI001F4832F3|nr:hypothetical protein [Shinella sp. NM-101]